jgi:hypothetical protein
VRASSEFSPDTVWSEQARRDYPLKIQIHFSFSFSKLIVYFETVRMNASVIMV